MSGAPLSGGHLVVRALRAAGVTHAFGVPGESFLDLLDGLYDAPEIRLVATRHEGGAAFMAEAFARLTGRLTVCMGTRMVGGGNLAIGIHTARQDSAPVLALLGQVGTGARYREAFQEADLAQVFAPVAKWAAEPPATDRLEDVVLRAARIARAGRPGPVVLALREDVLAGCAEPGPEPEPALEVPRLAPDGAALARALEVLRRAERPVLILGGTGRDPRAQSLFVELAEAEQLPVVASWREPDVFPNDHPLYLGQSGLSSPPSVARRLHAADAVLAVGTRLDEYTTDGYSVPTGSAPLIHVWPEPEEVGGHVTAAVPCAADPVLFAEGLLALSRADPLPPEQGEARAARTAEDRARWEAETTPTRGKARPGYVDQQVVMAQLRARLPRQTVVVTDAGNFSGWGARYLRWNEPGTALGPISGAMGYGIPAAIAARLAYPDRPVLALVGDGGFLMTGVELETAVRERVPLLALVYDNAQYGTIRMHQERHYPGRPIATALGPVDAAGFATALGAVGIRVGDERDLPAALDEGLRVDRPVVLHLRVDADQLSVGSDAW